MITRRNVVKLNHGLLEVPKLVRLPSPKSENYILGEIFLDGYKFLFIFPRDDFNQGESSGQSIISSTFKPVDLEGIVNEKGNLSVQLPKSALKYLGLRCDSRIAVLVNANGYISAWNGKCFEWPYKTNQDNITLQDF